MTYADISKIDINLNERIGTLEFYKDELDILSHRLLEVSGKNTDSEVQKSVEHFQNQFDIQRQNISDLQHQIRSGIHNCVEDIKFHAGKVSTTVTEKIRAINDEVLLFEKKMKELRTDYNRFLSKWM